MERAKRNLEALRQASENAGRAIDACRSEEYAKVPKEHKQAWAMAALIHCDMTRLVVALDNAEGATAKLLWMADLSAKLFEAKRWYIEHGAPLLLSISEQNQYGSDAVRLRINTLKTEHKIGKIERLAKYRNKLSYHYDKFAIDHLERFESQHAEEFFKVVSSFSRFSKDWAKLTKDVLTHAVPTAKV